MTGIGELSRLVAFRPIRKPRKPDGSAGQVSAPSSPAALRSAGDHARALRLWWLDAFYRRLLIERPRVPPGDWLQYGHALKEMGQFDAAERAYRKASEGAPRDPEVPLQLGHLFKIMNKMQAAITAFKKAAELGYAHADAIAFELKLIEQACALPWRGEAHARHEGLHVFLSSPSGLFGEDNRSELVGLGGADYSYSFAMRGFIDALEELEIEYSVIRHPEYVADIRSRSDAAFNIHLGFYPAERIRLLKGAYNINCFAWEFDRLRAPAELVSYHAFADQATMLSAADEIWVPSSGGTEAVSVAVTKPVYHVAAPILTGKRRKARKARPSAREMSQSADALKGVTWQPLAVLPRIQGTMNGMARDRESTTRALLRMTSDGALPSIYLTVLNVHDFRKQLRPMLEGFIQFSRRAPSARLLIKMTTPDRGKLTINEFLAMDQISSAGRLTPPLVSDRIWITDQFLTRAELTSLYDASSFYVCTSFAEGQNLPLLEAMARGVVPVSVDNSAMADYISTENALIIHSEQVVAEPRLSTRYGIFGIHVGEVAPEAVERALAAGSQLSEDAYRALSLCSAEIVERDFGVTGIRHHIDRILSNLKEVQG